MSGDGRRRTQAWLGGPIAPPVEPPVASDPNLVPDPVPASPVNTWGPPPAHLVGSSSAAAAAPAASVGHQGGELVGGRYRLQQQLGRGALTETWEAIHIELERAVAIKFILPQLQQGLGEAMLDEARTVARIRHPHVVEFSDFGRDAGGEPYFVMELLAGQTLGQVLADRGSLPWARAVTIARQIAEALTAAHKQGVIHRDLRPGNVFLVDTGEVGDFVKVVDFGLARADAFGAAPGYMSPEQCRGEPLDPRSDVYALGCLLFAMITGDPPFVGERAQVMHAQIQQPAKFLSERAPRQFISEELEAVVARCLAKLPVQRFADTRELALELGRIAQAAAAASIAGAPVIRDPSPGESMSMPMGYAGRTAPRDARELDAGFKTNRALAPEAGRARGAKPATSSKAEKAEKAEKADARAKDVQQASPVAASPRRSNAAIVGLVLGVAVLVGGASIGGTLLWQRSQARDDAPTKSDEAPEPAGAAPSEEEAPPIPEVAPRDATTPETAPDEPEAAPDAKADGAATSKPASSKPASSKPASSKPASSKPASSKPASGEPASGETKAPGEITKDEVPEPAPKPSEQPDSQAKPGIDHEELIDPWG